MAELDAELASHMEEAIAGGRDPDEVRRAFGSPLRHREYSLDVKVHGWLDNFRADIVFGYRQLLRRKISSAVAAVSLALAIGGCITAFRIIDAMFLRPLPVAAPDRLYALVHRGIDFDGQFEDNDFWLYPMFRRMRSAVQGQAELLAISEASSSDVRCDIDNFSGKAYLQFVSGWMFRDFQVAPAIGRVLSDADDTRPGADPVAVLSYDFWNRQFRRDPAVLGRSLFIDGKPYTIVGVTKKGFTGIEPGTMTDIFLPTMMNANVERSDFYWIRTIVHLKPGISIQSVRQKLQAVYKSFQQDQTKALAGLPSGTIKGILDQQVIAVPASAGISDTQQEYRTALTILGLLVLLVLLIASANILHLRMAQAQTRSLEMMLRISIGAGRLRLIQLLLVESALLALFSTALGTVFAWWAAPFVVSQINPPADPVRLVLSADGRVFWFLAALASSVLLLFGLAPALHASQVKPAGRLRPHRFTYLLVTLQSAFGCLIFFVAGLFVTSLNHLANQPTGFLAPGLLNIQTASDQAPSPETWNRVADRLRALPGVQSVALADWPLLSANARGGYISVGGKAPFADPAYFLKVSPEWLHTMRIPLLAGRDFQDNDSFPRRVIVNRSFLQHFFGGSNALGQSFTTNFEDQTIHMQIIGVAADARYGDLRGPMLPVIYFPFQVPDRKIATFVLRLTGSRAPSSINRIIAETDPLLHVTDIESQREIDASHTVRERLVALLGGFFGVLAVLLAAIGLYGILQDNAVQRRRDIAIRVALGARPLNIVHHLSWTLMVAVSIGVMLGLVLGRAASHYIQSLLYGVTAEEWTVLFPVLLVMLVSSLAALAPALLNAATTEPALALRDSFP